MYSLNWGNLKKNDLKDDTDEWLHLLNMLRKNKNRLNKLNTSQL